MTRGGRALLLLATPTLAAGVVLHWTELVGLGLTALALVAGSLVTVLLPRRAHARVEARPWRTTVGSTTRVDVAVRASLLPMSAPRVRLEGEVLPQELRLPNLWPGRERTETFEDRARRRGVFDVGPLVHLRSDPLGLFRRETRWGTPGTLWVRPRVLVPGSFLDGAVFDLEGLPSEQMSTSDLAFHALREYVPGDDLRRVHWRSSAKAETLLVRQYVESRTLHSAFLLDDDPEAYASPAEFELAVSAAASLALRGLADGFEVDLLCGDRASSPAGPGTLLDECCHVHLAASGEHALVARALQLSRLRSRVGLVVVVTGSRSRQDRVFEAMTVFGAQSRRFVVRAELGSGPVAGLVHGVRTLTVGDLPDLAALAVVAPR
jgi:uncharacterized protein (DUF58 family)